MIFVSAPFTTHPAYTALPPQLPQFYSRHPLHSGNKLLSSWDSSYPFTDSSRRRYPTSVDTCNNYQCWFREYLIMMLFILIHKTEAMNNIMFSFGRGSFLEALIFSLQCVLFCFLSGLVLLVLQYQWFLCLTTQISGSKLHFFCPLGSLPARPLPLRQKRSQRTGPCS